MIASLRLSVIFVHVTPNFTFEYKGFIYLKLTLSAQPTLSSVHTVTVSWKGRFVMESMIVQMERMRGSAVGNTLLYS